MNRLFDILLCQLRRGTFWSCVATLVFVGAALVTALLGFTRAVESFLNCAVALGFFSVFLLCLFLLASVVGVCFRRLDRRAQAPDPDA